MAKRVECIKTEFGYFELNSKVKVSCKEGYGKPGGIIDYSYYSVGGYLTDAISDKENNITKICISETLNEPLDGMYTWIGMDFIINIQEI